MRPAVVLFLLALVFGGVGLFIAVLRWALMVALALAIAGVLTEWSERMR